MSLPKSPATATLILDDGATFATDAATEGTGCAEAPPSMMGPHAGMELAGRYVLVDVLGRGGFGSVWSARLRDSEPDTAPTLAIKLLHALSSRALAVARREIAALRWARLPGVVRLLDDGSHQGDYFIVMERVSGTPFPGDAGPQPWSVVEPVVIQLLEILARLHLAGLYHRDLKPDNVLVDATGRPTLIDLGIASGRALQDSLKGAYTPAYAAPEQILGEACDARTDLYAVGVMLFQALSGTLPHDRRLLERLQDAPTPVREVCPDLPAPVAAVIDAMRAPRMADRPDSALAVLDALGGELPLLLGGGGLSLPNSPQTSEALWSLFHGPDHFFHFREDAANELWARTHGQPAAIEAELGAWLRAGIGHWEDGAVRIDRVAIRRLEAGLRLSLDGPGVPSTDDEAALLGLIELSWPAGRLPVLRAASDLPLARFDEALAGLLAAERVWFRPDRRVSCRPRVQPAAEWTEAKRQEAHAALASHSAPADRLRHLVGADADAAVLLTEARRLTRQRIEDGELNHILPPLELGLTLARRLGDRGAEVDLLVLWALWALGQHTKTVLNRALYEIERLAPLPWELEPVHRLLKAYECALDRQGERALELLETVSEFADERLEIWRVTTLVGAVRCQKDNADKAEEELITSLEAWAQRGSIERHGKLFGWKGNIAYRKRLYTKAARLHLKAAESKKERFARLSSLINSASSLLDGFKFTESKKLSITALNNARTIRHPKFESQALWLLRNSKYRCGTYVVPDTSLPKAAKQVDQQMYGLFCMCEAMMAWRIGDNSLSMQLAKKARLAFPKRKQRQFLLRTLEIASGAKSNHQEQTKIIQFATENAHPDFSIQILGLLKQRQNNQNLEKLILNLASHFPKEHHNKCLDIISVHECIKTISKRGEA